MKTLKLLLVNLLIFVILASPALSQNETTPAQTTAAPTVVATPTGITVPVRVQFSRFAVSTLQINVGDQVLWDNFDETKYTLVETNNKLSNITLIDGKKILYPFNIVGEYTFGLYYNSMQTAPSLQTIIVMPPSTFTSTPTSTPTNSPTPTSTPTPTPTPTPTQIITPYELKQGYKLNLLPYEKIHEITLQLIHDGNVVDKKTFDSGQNFNFYDGSSLIVKGKVETVFHDINILAVFISDLVQYDKVTGEKILSEDYFSLIARSSSPTPASTITDTPVITPSMTPTPTATPVATVTETNSKPKVGMGDFTVGISPTSITVNPGETMRFTLTIMPSGGFNEPVEIYVKVKALGQEQDFGRVKTIYPPYQAFVFENPVPDEIPKGTTIYGYVTAKGGGLEHDAGTVTVKVPGFEMLPMIVAVGIAIFLIRRKN